MHVTTYQEKKEVEKLHLGPPCYTLPNPIDLGNLQPNQDVRNSYRRQYGINKSTPLLLICGRQHHKKGLDLLPKVLSRLNQFDWRIFIVGNDEDGTGTALISSLEKEGLLDRLIQMGNRPATELSSIYNAADLLLLPSRHENFGNVVVEALSQGCPVICTDMGGTKEIVKENGIIIPENKKYNFELTDYDKPYDLNIDTAALTLDKKDVIFNLNIANVAESYIEVFNENLYSGA